MEMYLVLTLVALLFGVSHGTTKPLVKPVTCGSGWAYYKPGNTCFKLIEKPKTYWAGARKHCQGLSVRGDLAVIPDPDTGDFIKRLLKPLKSHWVGLHVISDDGTSHWLDEKQIPSYLPEISMFPKWNKKNNQKCYFGVLVNSKLILKRSDCTVAMPFVCQGWGIAPKPQDKPLPGPTPQDKPLPEICGTDDWIVYSAGKTCFKVISNRNRDWSNARKLCQSFSPQADLAVITDRYTEKYIFGIVKPYYGFWMGLNNISSDGQLIWLDNKKLSDYKPAMMTNPSKLTTGSAECIYSYRTKYGPSVLRYKKVKCSIPRPFVCQILDKDTPTTIPKTPEIAATIKPQTKSVTETAAAPKPQVKPIPEICRTEGWREYTAGRTCFKLITKYQTWSGARKACQSLSPQGDLAVITDKDTEKFVFGIIKPYNSVWTALNKISIDKQLLWFDKKKLSDYRSVAMTHPKYLVTGVGECLYGYRTKNGPSILKYKRVKCKIPRSFVCQILDKDPTPPKPQPKYVPDPTPPKPEPKPDPTTTKIPVSPVPDPTPPKPQPKYVPDPTPPKPQPHPDPTTSKIPVSPAPAPCRSDWYLDRPVNTCFKVISTRMNWTTARNHCQNLSPDGDLAVIPDAATEAFVALLLKAYDGTWLGLNNITSDGQLLWLDNKQTPGYQPKTMSDPSKLSGGDRCFFVFRNKLARVMNFRKITCGSIMKFVCGMPASDTSTTPKPQAKPEPATATTTKPQANPVPETRSTTTPQATPAPCRSDWYLYRPVNTCFKVISTRMNWTTARNHCQNLSPDGDLAVIPDAATEAFVALLLKAYDGTWLGLNNITSDGQLLWLDNKQTPGYQPKTMSDPSKLSGGDRCFFVFRNKLARVMNFRKITCGSIMKFVCGMPASDTLTTPKPQAKPEPATATTTKPQANPVPETRSTTTPQATPAPCRSDWYLYRPVNTCFKVISTRMNWTTARNHCQNLSPDGDLAVIPDAATEAFVALLLKAYDGTWLGLNNITSDGQLLWLDNKQTPGYQPKTMSDPSKLSGGDRCFFVFRNKLARVMNFRKITCGSIMKFVCGMPASDTLTTPKPQAKPEPATATTTKPQANPVPETRSTTTPQATPAPCRSDWYLDRPVNTCFKVISTRMNWTTARNHCQNLSPGGDLAVIPDAATEAFVSLLLKAYDGTWLGLNNITSDGQLLWLDNKQTPGYQPKTMSDPSKLSGGDRCFFVFRNKLARVMNFRKITCGSIMKFVCGMPASDTLTTPKPQAKPEPATATTRKPQANPVPETRSTTTPQATPVSTCQKGWGLDVRRKMCVKIFEDKKRTWEKSRENCKKNGGDLVVIPDSDTLEFVKGLMSRHRYWIGLVDRNHNGKFAWLDEKEEITFTAWNNKPRNIQGKEYCVEAIGNHGARWNDKLCWKRRYSICQMKAETTTKS